MGLKTCAVVAMIAVSGLLVGGCANGFCETYCEFVDDCVFPIDNQACIDDCVVEYKDEDNDCQGALREWDRCVDGRSCESSASNCVGEYFEVAEQCRRDW